MSSQMKLRRGSSASHAAFTGAQGEVTFDTDTKELVAHDGATPGGFPTVKKAALAASGGSALIGHLPAGTGAVSRTVQNTLRDSVSVKDFGAVGDGATNDTAAIQAAVTYACTLNGKSLYFPHGTYKITAAIVIPFSTGWRIYGASRGGVTISQATDNVPIFHFIGDLTHSWSFDGMGFTYANQQFKATSPNACIFYLDSPSNSNIFNFVVQNCLFSNTYRTLGVNRAKNQLAVWGTRFFNCIMGGSCTGAMYDIQSGTAVGDPNISFDQIHLDCTSQQEPAINIWAGDQVSLKDVEFNNGVYNGFVQMSIGTSSIVTLVNVKCEVVSLVNGAGCWDFPQTQVVAIGVKFLAVVTSGSGTSALMQGPGNGSLALIGYYAQASGNNCAAYSFSDIKSVSSVVCEGTVSRNPRTVLGNVAMPRHDSDMFAPGYVQSNGDTAVVMTGISGAVQRFNATLTANRSITLPSTGIVDGREYSIVRDAATPGAFSLQVVDPISGANHTFASGAKGFVRYRAIGSAAYMILAAGTLP